MLRGKFHAAVSVPPSLQSSRLQSLPDYGNAATVGRICLLSSCDTGCRNHPLALCLLRTPVPYIFSAIMQDTYPSLIMRVMICKIPPPPLQKKSIPPSVETRFSGQLAGRKPLRASQRHEDPTVPPGVLAQSKVALVNNLQ
jgi:hypothetical protein